MTTRWTRDPHQDRTFLSLIAEASLSSAASRAHLLVRAAEVAAFAHDAAARLRDDRRFPGGCANRRGRERRGGRCGGDREGDGGDRKQEDGELAHEVPQLLRAPPMKYLSTLHVNARFTRAPSRAPTSRDGRRRSPARPRRPRLRSDKARSRSRPSPT